MVLIDTGLDETDRIQIQETMKTWGLEKRQISDVFLTHAHFDHAGNAFWFEKAGAHVWAGEADADSIEKVMIIQYFLHMENHFRHVKG